MEPITQTNMFTKIFDKLSTFGEHHQMLFAGVVTLGVILVSWGVEKILEEFIFPHKPRYGYVLTVLIGLSLLWLTKHVILHVL